MSKRSKRRNRGGRFTEKSRPGDQTTGLGRGDPQIKIPRPSVTEFTRVTAVPVFPQGEAGLPEGSPGDYEVRFVLGVPGVSTVVDEMNLRQLLHSGDSLLTSKDMAVETDSPGVEIVSIHANSNGRLGEARVKLAASSKLDAEKVAHDLVMPILSRLAFDADAAVEVRATVVVELGTGTQMMGAHLVGAVKPVIEPEGQLSPELRVLLAMYRDGLNSTNPLHQVLSFYKAIDGAESFHKRRTRRAGKGTPVTAPIDEVDVPPSGVVP